MIVRRGGGDSTGEGAVKPLTGVGHLADGVDHAEGGGERAVKPLAGIGHLADGVDGAQGGGEGGPRR